MTRLTNVKNYINSPGFSGYQGLVFDVEEGTYAPPVTIENVKSAFEAAFQAAKSKGLKVLVTVSHSAPYGLPNPSGSPSDASKLMDAFFASSNIDYISPQLYTSGSEGSNDYTTSGGVPWSRYKNSKAKVVPSIVRSSLYASAQTYFSGQGITLAGYVQWAQF